MGRDYHIHTTFSDGTLSPEELIKTCCEKEIMDIAITDHYATRKYSDKFQVTDVGQYVRALNELKGNHPDMKIHIGLEVDFSKVYGKDPKDLDFCQLNQVDFLLFEHVNTEKVEGNPVNGRELKELLDIRKKFNGPVGLAHNDFQENFQGHIQETLICMKENDIFLELCEAEDKGKKTVDSLLLQQMMEIRKNFNSAFEVKEMLEKLKQKDSGNNAHMKHAVDGKYYFEIFEEDTWKWIQEYQIGISFSSDSHKGLQVGKCQRLTPYIQRYQLEKQIIFR